MINKLRIYTIGLIIIAILVITVAYFVITNRAEPSENLRLSESQTTNSLITPKPTLPTNCTDNPPEGAPVITSLSSSSGSIGAKIEISGCNLAGFEGDNNAWIENSKGEKGILFGETRSMEKSNTPRQAAGYAEVSLVSYESGTNVPDTFLTRTPWQATG